MNIHAYAAYQSKELLKPFLYSHSNLGSHQIIIKISHCGICYSDVHLIDNDWSISKYPLVPGHEIIGIVESKGAKVSELNIGDRVGVGWQAASCMKCEWCQKGKENLCPDYTATCVEHHGGFAHKVIVDERFAFKIPKNLDSAHAAPLLCAGVTVFSPLSRAKKKGAKKVGIIGVGGLGHLAVQFARKLGFEVTVFSHAQNKEQEAKRLGAHHFVLIDEIRNRKDPRYRLDFILSTVYVSLEWPTFLKVLRPNGELCFVGAVDEDLKFSVSSLISGQRTVSGSAIGDRATIKAMLKFASTHQIKAQIQQMPLSNINDALDLVRKNKVRYRMVLVI